MYVWYRCPAETDGSESEAAHRHRNTRKYRRSAENIPAGGGGGRDANTGYVTKNVMYIVLYALAYQMYFYMRDPVAVWLMCAL